MNLYRITPDDGIIGKVENNLPLIALFTWTSDLVFVDQVIEDLRSNEYDADFSSASRSTFTQRDCRPLYSRTRHLRLIDTTVLLLHDIRSAISATVISVEERR
jgi:hypothetical protein